MNILYIDSCLRDENISRTARIANAALALIEKQSPDSVIVKRKLSDIMPEYMSYELNGRREKLIAEGKLDNELFASAREFACADKIIISAPLWDLSFPAVLKAYIETVSVSGIAFRYTDNGSIGLCKADALMYITTRGGDFSVPPLSNVEFGESYLKAMSMLYGIDRFYCVAADGLDAYLDDTEKIIQSAIDKLPQTVCEFLN